jgi:hypothetical protein
VPTGNDCINAYVRVVLTFAVAAASLSVMFELWDVQENTRCGAQTLMALIIGFYFRQPTGAARREVAPAS